MSFTIKLKNERGGQGRYAFFTAKPVIDDRPDSDKVFLDVWISKRVEDGDSTEVTTNNKYYACEHSARNYDCTPNIRLTEIGCGRAPSRPGPGVMVTEGQSKQVRLGTYKDGGGKLKDFGHVRSLHGGS